MSSNYFGNDGATQFQGGGYGGCVRARDSLFVSLCFFLSLSLVLLRTVVLLLLLLLLLFEMMGFDF